MKKSHILAIVLVAIIIGLIIWLKPQKAQSPVAVAPSDIQNSTYTVEGQSVTLVNGVSEVAAAPGSASMVMTKYFGNVATGDLNKDGKDDTAFLITQNSGGSGTFYYVVVALKTATGYTGTNAVLLGDRIAPQTTEIKNGEIVVNYADRAPNEPMTTAPSVGVSKYFAVSGTTLTEITNQ